MNTNSRFSWPLLAVFSVLAAAAYAIFGPEALPGLALAIGPAAVGVGEIERLIHDIGGGIEDMKTRTAAELADMRREIERVEAKGNLHGLMSGGGGDLGADGSRVTRATPSEIKAFGQFLRTGDKSAAAAAKAITVGVGAEGGFAVPQWIDREVHSLASETAPLLNLVRRRKVGSFPSRHLVSDWGTAAGWVGETAARPATNTAELTAIDVTGGEIFANPQVTQWALDDIAFNVVDWLRRELARTFAQMLEGAILAGNGTNKPKGFLDGTPSALGDNSRPFGTLQYFPTGVSGALPATANDTVNLLLDVAHSIDQHYRSKAAWLMPAPTLSLLRRMRDADERPLLLDSLITKQPSTLLGYPVYECANMPAVGAGALGIAFGDFDAGYVLDEHSSGLRIVVDQFTNKPYTGYYTTMRVGGAVLDSKAIKLVKFSVS